MARSSNASFQSWFWPALCLALALTLLCFIYENRRLRNILLERSAQGQLEYDGARLGDRAFPIEGYLATGQLVTLAEDTLLAPLILAWFSDDCDACYFAKEGWSKLAGELPGQVWAIRKSYESRPDSLFFGETVDFQIITPTDSRIFDEYHVYGTPQTLLINVDRTVGQVWKGALNPDRISEILVLAKTPQLERR